MTIKIIFISLVVILLIILFVIFLDEARYSEGVGGKIFFLILYLFLVFCVTNFTVFLLMLGEFITKRY
jgi:hypothetical protein|nr:MAG TPA: hypothetical protein [Caudoviricetes sp.]